MPAMSAAASTCALLFPVPLVTCLRTPSSASLAQGPEPSRCGWAGSGAGGSHAQASPPGLPDRGRSHAGLNLVPSTRARVPARQLLREALAGRWLPAPAAPRKGPGLFQVQRKKITGFFFFFNPSEILSRCFAEVGALAAMASAVTLWACCAAPTRPGPCVSGKSQWIPTRARCDAARRLVLDAGSWVLNVKCHRNTSPRPPS